MSDYDENYMTREDGFKKDFKIPEGLSRKGKQVANKIRAMAEKGEWTAGGCTVFHKPDSENFEYGKGSELIVCYDGGYVGTFFDSGAAYEVECNVQDCAKEFGWDMSEHKPYSGLEKMDEFLKKLGVYSEPCTKWYTAIYKD